MRASVFLVLLPLLAFPGCSDGPTGSPPSGPQEYFFEVSYLNHAWGHQHRGVVVDRDGNVTGWDRSGDPWPPVLEESWTADELEAKYSSHAEPQGKVPGRVLDRMVRLIDDARAGKLTEPDHRCADAGGTTFRALVYDPPTDTYRGVLLRIEGDYFRENRSKAARTLFAWLDELTERRFANCGRE